MAVLQKKKKESFWRSILWALVIALIIRSFFVEAFRIPSGSMKNSLLVGDYLFVNKLSYYFKTPKYIPFTSKKIPYIGFKTFGVDRGDVVVFEFPGDRDLVTPSELNINYIKRCIGLPGDTVQVIDKQVFVNGKAMPNPPQMRHLERKWGHIQGMYGLQYIDTIITSTKGETEPNIFPTGKQGWNRDWYGPIRIPKSGDVLQLTPENIQEWEVFIRREGHTVTVDPNHTITIDEKPTNQYIVERDYLWMMGDNRHQSSDSRYWGFCPYENVVGSALFMYWSWYTNTESLPPGTQREGYDEEEEQSFHIRWNRLLNIVH